MLLLKESLAILGCEEVESFNHNSKHYSLSFAIIDIGFYNYKISGSLTLVEHIYTNTCAIWQTHK